MVSTCTFAIDLQIHIDGRSMCICVHGHVYDVYGRPRRPIRLQYVFRIAPHNISLTFYPSKNAHSNWYYSLSPCSQPLGSSSAVNETSPFSSTSLSTVEAAQISELEVRGSGQWRMRENAVTTPAS